MAGKWSCGRMIRPLTAGASARRGAIADRVEWWRCPGRRALGFSGKINAGLGGSILLDPLDLTIQSVGADDAQVSDGSIPGIGYSAGNFTVSSSAVEALTGNVVLEAQRI